MIHIMHVQCYYKYTILKKPGLETDFKPDFEYRLKPLGFLTKTDIKT